MKKIFFLITFFFINTKPAFAHEAYVLTRDEFQQGLKINTQNPFGPLLNTQMLPTFLIISIIIAVSFCINFLFASTDIASTLDKVIKKANKAGPLIIRLAISASFFYAAQYNSVLGPELTLANIPAGQIIRISLYALSISIFFGFFVELAAFIGLLIFVYITTFYKFYMITYANYFAELIVLLFFGSRFFSVDRIFFGKRLWVKSLEKFKEFEIPIVRILYGIALIYAGYTIKFQHENLSVAVYNQYHLVNYFHAAADFIASGAGLSEISIGLFILLGFAQRWTIIISLVFITLSLLYFHEMLWPHLMLYGISFSLIINSADKLTIDRYLVPFVRKLRLDFTRKLF